MDNLPERLSSLERVSDITTARKVLHSLLERIMALEIDNAELKKHLEAITADNGFETLQSEIVSIKRLAEGVERKTRAREELIHHGTSVPHGTAPAPGKKARAAPRFTQWLAVLMLIIMGNLAAAVIYVTFPNLKNLREQILPRKVPKEPPPSIAEDRKESPVEPPKPTVLALPFDHTVGLLRQDQLWISVNWMNGRIFALDGTDGKVKYTRPFPNSFTTGLSEGQDCLWSLDGFKLRIYKHDPKNFNVIVSAPTPGPSPSAVHWDGHSLWLADKKLRRVRQYLNEDFSSSTVSTEYKLAEAEPVGLWWAENLLWVLDASRKKVRRYQVKPEFHAVDTLDLAGWMAEEAKPTGFAIHDSSLWVMTNNPAFIYKQELKYISWTEEVNSKGSHQESEPPRRETPALAAAASSDTAPPAAPNSDGSASVQLSTKLGAKARAVDFAIVPPDAQQVNLLGTFLVQTGRRRAMGKDASGIWRTTVYLNAGISYPYRFEVVDSKGNKNVTPQKIVDVQKSLANQDKTQ